MSKTVQLPMRGGCLCGAIRYSVSAAPFFVVACHCSNCQRHSGSAFGMSMPVPRAAFQLVSGEPASFPRTTASGYRIVVRFCAVCATRLFDDVGPDAVVLRPGTLDDPSFVVPAAQVFTRSAHDWAQIARVPGYATQPADYGEIAPAWLKQGISFVESH